MNRILLLLLYVFLLSAHALGQEGGVCPARRCDSLHTFRFVQGRDVLYADYRGNDHELKRLFAAVTAFRSSIVDGKMRIYVDGYCTSGSSVRDNLRLGYVRSSRVARCGGGMPARTVGGRYPEPFPLCRVCLPLSAFARTGSFVAGGRNVPGTRSSRTVPPARGGARIPCAGRALAGHLLPENQSVRLGGSDAGGPFGGFPSQPGCRTVLCPALVSGGLGGIFRLERGEGAPFLGCFGH